MADKFRLELFGDTEAFGPVVELTTEELLVLEKVFGSKKFYIAGKYEYVGLANLSERERDWEKRRAERKRKEEQAKREKKEAAAALRKKIIATTPYGNYSAMAIAFAKAKEEQRRR